MYYIMVSALYGDDLISISTGRVRLIEKKATHGRELRGGVKLRGRDTVAAAAARLIYTPLGSTWTVGVSGGGGPEKVADD